MKSITNVFAAGLFAAGCMMVPAGIAFASNAVGAQGYNVPEGYFDETDHIPAFWLATIDEVNGFLQNNVREGKVEQIGTSAGGRPIYSVSYGTPRQGKGTTTFSGSISLRKDGTQAYRGPDSGKSVYVGLAGVHGFELEGIMGMINLISVMETGKDLTGQSWPEITELKKQVGRIVLIPMMGPDGRARVPVRMEKHRGGNPDSYIVHQYLNTGGLKNGEIIGWPQVKEFIPMDFSAFSFPGGYPNDAGVNIMHDDFFGQRQPETQALFDLMAKEKPDLLLNMHTGVWYRNYFMTIHRPFTEPALQRVFDQFYTQLMTRLTEEGLRGTRDAGIEANPASVRQSTFNLDTALNLHSGVLSIVVESPSHGYDGQNLAGDPSNQTPEKLLKAQLIAHQEALRFLMLNGSRENWKTSESRP